MSPTARIITTAVKQMSSCVPGSPQSKLAFRSRAFASPIRHGPATCMINLCPSELSARWVFVIGEPQPLEPYEFDNATGECRGRLPTASARRYVSQNFWACADFFHAYMLAFNEIMLGWPMEGHYVQSNPSCLFGVVLSWMWSYEESNRGGIHAHGLVTMRTLQAENLKKLCIGNAIMQRRIIEFSEAIACAMMPQDPPPMRQEVTKILEAERCNPC